MPHLDYHDLKKVTYQDALEKQKMLFNELIQNKLGDNPESIAGALFLCEHNPVYTLGRNADESNFRTTLNQVDAEIHKIGRGGDVTYHGPGQLVGYPVVDLEKWPMGLAEYVHSLEKTIVNTLMDYGIKSSTTKSAPGVWIDPDTPQGRKIAALGIQSSRWVTMHGFALNVNTDLDYFNHIIPCGIPDKSVTSIKEELGREVDMDEVKSKFRDHFSSVFEVTWEPLPDVAE